MFEGKKGAYNSAGFAGMKGACKSEGFCGKRVGLQLPMVLRSCSRWLYYGQSIHEVKATSGVFVSALLVAGKLRMLGEELRL